MLLCALTMGLPQADLKELVVVVFSLSACFFWLSDSSSSENSSNGHVERIQGLMSFFLLGAGHALMGVANNFHGLLISALLFGLGQATSTGLRTLRKDDVRMLLRANGHGEVYRKSAIRMLSGLSTATNVVNSLVVGFLGEYVGMGAAAIFYAGIAFVGFLWSFRLDIELSSLILADSKLSEPLAT
eukprot:gnl/TRDRNA2_/TRDRNA2_208037_c0_seq1.p1 gnl/TRDRNA2_/TRDRNA2_208037_c0~~gnl/TRDRNA2_/TRDRNA2_208037_c0_seq1.p1  ORF type:complete len:186 (-),score=23.96 gnl/TRDRNA2_/TRDRNA2_208037_c0_seq1:42-599(-)